MIDVKELKIGNIISYNKEPCFVTTINYLQPRGNYETFFVGLKSRDTYSAKIDQIEPVILTEEILLKCGFRNRTMG